MQDIHSVALYIFVIFYIFYILIAIIQFHRVTRLVRKQGLTITPTRTVGESGRVAVTAEGIIVTIVTIGSIYVMGRWIFQQVLDGCMQIGWWNPVCYDMNTFNRSWFAVFVVIAVNAIMLSVIYDTKHQDKRLSR